MGGYGGITQVPRVPQGMTGQCWRGHPIHLYTVRIPVSQVSFESHYQIG